jgi:hypothetical protein
MKPVFITIVVFIVWTNSALAQNLDIGSWNILNLKYNHNEKWSVFGEAQLRSLKSRT